MPYPLLEAVPAVEHIENVLAILRGSWVISEARLDYLTRCHLRMFRGGLAQFDELKRLLLGRSDVLRMVLRGRSYIGFLRTCGEVAGQEAATRHDVWLFVQAVASRVNEMSPATPSA